MHAHKLVDTMTAALDFATPISVHQATQSFLLKTAVEKTFLVKLGNQRRLFRNDAMLNFREDFWAEFATMFAKNADTNMIDLLLIFKDKSWTVLKIVFSMHEINYGLITVAALMRTDIIRMLGSLKPSYILFCILYKGKNKATFLRAATVLDAFKIEDSIHGDASHSSSPFGVNIILVIIEFAKFLHCTAIRKGGN